MKYTASSIVKRAFNLADLANTDFISYTETTEYLNDAWREVYDYIINHGDKQFVSEVILGGPSSSNFYTEYTLPWDLYRIQAIQSISGSYQVERRSPTGTTGYEIVNNKLRIYGTASYTGLKLIYYRIPFYLSFPDRDISIGSTGDIVGTAGDSILYSDGSVINSLSNETIANITDLEWFAKLGNGHYITDTALLGATDTDIEWKSFNNDIIHATQLPADSTRYYIFDNYYNAYLIYIDDNKAIIVSPNSSVETSYLPLVIYDDIIIGISGTTNVLGVYSRETNELLGESTLNNVSPEDVLYPVPEFDNCKSFLLRNKLFMVREDYTLQYEDLTVPTFITDGYTKHGIICNNGTDRFIISRIPDTYLNFPNEIFFSLVAANLGLRFLTKQNAEASGLNTLYENMLNSYFRSLSQDSGYPVVRNVR